MKYLEQNLKWQQKWKSIELCSSKGPWALSESDDLYSVSLVRPVNSKYDMLP